MQPPTRHHLPFPAWPQNDSKVSCPHSFPCPLFTSQTWPGPTPQPLPRENTADPSSHHRLHPGKASPWLAGRRKRERTKPCPKPQSHRLPFLARAEGWATGQGGNSPSRQTSPAVTGTREDKEPQPCPGPATGTQGCVKPGAERGSIPSTAGEQIRPFGR